MLYTITKFTLLNYWPYVYVQDTQPIVRKVFSEKEQSYVSNITTTKRKAGFWINQALIAPITITHS